MDAWNSQRLPFSKKRLPKKVVLSYILDYVIIVIFVVGFYALDAVEPYHQHFALQNYTLQYPYAVKERVPVKDLVLIAVLAPAVIIAIYTLLIDGLFSHQAPAGMVGSRRKLTGRYRMKDRLWEMNCGILGLLLSVGAAFTITGTLKNAVGKPRPDLIDRCQPQAGSHDPVPYGLSNHSICTQTDNAILKDGFRSFPSGHSSTAFGGLFYLSIYLAAKMHLLDSRGEVWKSFIILIPTLGAALVAASRIMDARHHPFDVLSGSLIGILTAWGSYRQYFPAVSETWRKGRAYPIRSWGKEPVPPEPLDRTDEGVEPMRDMGNGNLKTIDEERPLSDANLASLPGGPSTANIFRQQISNSQRHRQLAEHAYSNARGTPSSVYTSDLNRAPSSTYTSKLPASNPFAAELQQRRRNRGDGYTSSSSEDEAEGIELQRGYTMRSAQSGATYNTVDGGFSVDTGYRSQTAARAPGLDEADLGTRPGVGLASPSLPPPVPQHQVSAQGYPVRGASLEERYA